MIGQRQTPVADHVRHHAHGYCRTCYRRVFTPDANRVRSAGRGRSGACSSDDVDAVAVERAIRGDDTIRLHSAELHAAVGALNSYRLSGLEIARRLGVSERTVYRHLARIRKEAA